MTRLKELETWLKKNSKKMKKENLSLFQQKYYLFKLKIKNFLNNFI